MREGKLKDTALTEKQQTLVTEVVAMQMEETFGSEDAINRLYLAVALTKIETGVMGDTMLENQASTRLLPVSTISIPDLVKKINPRDENFFKYVPDAFLSEKQIEAKKRALAREAKKYGRVQYSRKSGKGVTPYSQIIPAEEHEYRGLTDISDATGHQEAVSISKEEMELLRANYTVDDFRW